MVLLTFLFSSITRCIHLERRDVNQPSAFHVVLIFRLIDTKAAFYFIQYSWTAIARSSILEHNAYNTIIASEFYSTYHLHVVQVLCLPTTTLNLLMNAFVHPYLVFYVVFISRIIFLLITSIPIFILRVVCTHTGGHYYTHNICIVFLLINILIFTTYLINFLIYLCIILFYFTLISLR